MKNSILKLPTGDGRGGSLCERMTKLVLPIMRKQKSGKIVNISSIGGKMATPMGGWYHASKFAVEALSDSLRMEVKQ